MKLLGWTWTGLARPLPDGALALRIELEAAARRSPRWTTPRARRARGHAWHLDARRGTQRRAGARAGFHDPANEQTFSEEFQADRHGATINMAAQLPTLRGTTP